MTAAPLLLLLLVFPAAAFWGTTPDSLVKSKQLFEQHRYAEVVATLPPGSLQKMKPSHLREAYFFLGSSYEGLGQLDRALGVYQLGVKIFPKDIGLATALASLLLQMGLAEQAEPLFKRVLIIHPNNAVSNRGLGQIKRSQGFLEKSAQHYEKALEEMSLVAPAWREYADVLLNLRDYKTAELAAGKALALSPDAESYALLALVQRASGRQDQALDSLQKALSLSPERNDIAMARALWLLEASRWDESFSAAEKLLKVEPGNPIALWIKARFYLKNDRFNQAVRQLESAALSKTPFVAKTAHALLFHIRGEQ